MSSTTQPSIADYLNAADWSYSQGAAPLPPGFTYLMHDGVPVTQYDAATGFYGAALVNATGQVLITYEGTNLFTGNAEFTAAQIVNDIAITLGLPAPSYRTAESFAQTALSDAQGAGYASSSVFLDGHSLGGANAEFVATQLGLAGATFGAPGIGSYFFVSPSHLTNYVEQGDPVGNYATDPPRYEGTIIQSSYVAHYGGQDLVGPAYHNALLQAAATAYAAGNITGAVLLLGLAVPYHLLGTYAADLGVTLDVPDYSAMGVLGAMPCFASGTAIATPGGPRAVETLAPGDAVLTGDGTARTVVWVGRREVDCGRHPDPRQVRPVRVAAGAFAPGVPSRDLLLSPDHAIHAEGVLIPVRYLINGTTVAQLPAARVTYHHVELATHAVLLAEGLPVESFLDTGQRALMAGEGTPPHPPQDAARIREALACAPHCIVGPEVARVRAHLARRAAATYRRPTHPAAPSAAPSAAPLAA